MNVELRAAQLTQVEITLEAKKAEKKTKSLQAKIDGLTSNITSEKEEAERLKHRVAKETKKFKKHKQKMNKKLGKKGFFG